MPDLLFRTSRGALYGITTEPGILANAGLKLRSVAGEADQAVIITDHKVEALYSEDLAASLARAGFQTEVLAIEPGEPSKSLPVAISLWDRLVDLGFRRRGILIAFGGGVVTDLTGFVAAAFMRGVGYANMPTTLLAQLDAAVGSKVGVNHGRAKNLIGFFHHPLAVYNDTAVLKTLPAHEMQQGIAEAVKVAVIGSIDLFEYLETHMTALLSKHVDVMAELVAKSVAVKCGLLAPDLYEHDLRRVLNFGHAIGHALETATSYNRISHGDAISIGMAAATRLARARGLLEEDAAHRIVQLLTVAGLPTTAEKLHVSLDRIWGAISVVRSVRDGQLHEVLPTAIGRCTFTNDLTKSDLAKHIFP